MDSSLIALQPGTIIASRYEVIKCLGTGSMGVVYACRHRELAGHLVAIKVLFPEVAQDETSSARFRNEIFASYGVSHPNVVRAYEYIRDGDLVAYTMEYVEGGDLADRLNLKKIIPISEIIDMLIQMCAGVQAIHDAGIVHRDLKPENILLRKDGVVKIADFGIARTGNGPKLTEHGGVVGTIDYVSPEYILESHVDWRSDIYAIGILAYEMITGQSPFRADSVYATMTMRLKTDPKPPSVIRPEAGKDLDRIILKAMARAPENRYQSASEIQRDLIALDPSYLNRAPVMSAAFNKPEIKRNDTREIEITPKVASQGAYFGSARHSSSGTEVINRNAIFGSDLTAGPSVMLGSANDSTLIDSPELELLTSSASSHEKPVFDFNKSPRMDPLLSRSGTPGKTQGNRSISSSPVIENRDRLRQLTENTARSKSSYWLEIISIILAMVVGIGAGLYVMQSFIFPNSKISFDNGESEVKELDAAVE